MPSSLLQRVQRRRPLIALILLILLLVGGYAARAVQDHSSSRTTPAASAPVQPGTGQSAAIALSQLPAQARQTLALIQRGGPFPYRHDGIVYQNRQKQLPSEPSGYYHEYTVVTPGSEDRGTRRIVTGMDGSFWYTGDHYATFRRVNLSG